MAHGDTTREQTPTVQPSGEDAQTQERRTREQVERVMEQFRAGLMPRFKATAAVVDELDKWTGVSDEDRGKALDSLLAELNSSSTATNGKANPQRAVPSASTQPLNEPRSGSKRGRGEVEEIIDKLSKGGESDGEDDDDNSRVRKRHADEKDMPWYNAQGIVFRNHSCTKTCQTLTLFSNDFSGTKALLRVAHNLPEGIPSSQWDRILRGESVDLNQVFSSMHCVQLNEERKGRFGDAEVIFAVTEPKRQVKTGADWSAAFRKVSRAVTFLFPHRKDELSEYAEYIETLFAAKQVTAHPRIIMYDQAIRNQVGGGQNILLTDGHRFAALGEAILRVDGVEYGGTGTSGSSSGKGGSKGKQGGGGSKTSGSRKHEICKNFNSQGGCKFSEDNCYYKHTCQGCGKGGHGKTSCNEGH